jgi:oligosaccharide repeat unit polymerase
MFYKTISPLSLIGLPWALTFFLYQLDATENLVELDTRIVVTLSFMLILFFFATVLPLLGIKKRRLLSEPGTKINTYRLNKAIRTVFWVWLLGSCLDIFYSGGLPLVWALTDSPKNYTDFGIPSFHGLINAFYFALVACIFLKTKAEKSDKAKYHLIALLLWPVLMLGRGIMLSVVVQLVIMQIFFAGVSTKKIVSLLLLALMITVLFGVLGDFRGYENPFQGLVNDRYETIFNLLPSGFLWVYIYVTSPLSNLSYNYVNLIPVWDFFYSSVNLFPSALRPAGLDRADNFAFVSEALNVSTIFASSHSDFGVIGDLVLLVLLAAWTSFWYYRMTSSVSFILPYSLVGVVLFFSIFYNLFLLYPYLFSTVLLGCIASYVKK